VTGDQVTLAGVVQQSADTALSGDGDRSLLQVDSSGWLKVNVKAGGGSGGTAQADESAFTEGTTQITPIGGVLNDTITSDPTEDQAAAVRITAKRGLHANLRKQDGTEIASGGGAEANALRVTVANDSTGVLSVDDNGGSLTVDNGGTFPVQDSEKLADNAAFTDGTTKLDMAGFIFDETAGTALTENDAAAARVDSKRAIVFTIEDETTRGRRATVTASNALKVDGSAVTQPVSATDLDIRNLTAANDTVVANAGSGTFTTSDTASQVDDAAFTPGTSRVVMFGAEMDDTSTNPVEEGDGGALRMSSRRELYSQIRDAAGNERGANVNASNELNVSAAVTSIAAGDNNIGNVDIVTMPNVTLAAGTNTNEVVGDAAHDAAAAGNPVLTCGVAQDQDDTAPPNRVSAESDATRLATDRDGALFVRPFGPQVWSYHENSSSALTDASVHAAPGAGLSLYVTDIVVSIGAATAFNIFFEEGTTTVLGPYYLEAVNGRGLAIHFGTPKKITANTALTVTTSAAIAHAIDITGYTAQG
jgi:hypothetical protein